MRLRLRQQRLLDLIAGSPLSQNHWALRIGLSRGHWSEIVNGKHPYPSAKTRRLMLDAFQLPVHELFDVETGVPPWADSDFRRAIEDRYLIDRELGQGGMGAVYLARDGKHGRIVAVKVISPEAVSDIGLAQFQREIATVAQLHHPSILPLYDSGEAAGHPYYVMPWVRQGSLRTRLDRDLRLDLPRAVRMLRGMADALHHAHGERVLHCDIKPANVLLHGDHPWLMDFGIARKLLGDASDWRRGELNLSAGTPAYVSPEQAAGEADLDGRSDVYSLGCLAFEMLAGRPPFEGTNTREIVARRFIVPPPPLRDYAPDVPRPVEAALERAMALPREQRHATPVELAQDIKQAAQRRTLVASAGFSTARAAERMRRRIGVATPRPIGGLVRDVLSDVALAVRGMARAPGFTAIVVLTLGLAIGATATMFGIVDRLLLRAPAHIAAPDQVHRIHVARWFDNSHTRPGPSLSYPAFTDIRDRTTSFSHVAAFDDDEAAYGAGIGSRQLNVVRATGQYFPLLGAVPALGRFFGEEEDRAPGQAVAVISWAFWQSEFGGDPSVLGRTIQLDGFSYQIIGVAPRGFTGTQLRPSDVWTPIAALASQQGGTPQFITGRGYQWLRAVARLKPGVSPAAAEEDAARAYAVGHAEWQPYEARARASLAPLIAGRDPNSRSNEARVAGWLMLMAVIVLMIACANVANLMLARGLVRRGEIAVRRALGAGAGRLARQFATESIVLAVFGCAAGLAIAYWGGDILRAVLLPNTAFDASPLDGRVLKVSAFCALVAALTAGLLPLMFGSRANLSSAMRGTARSSIGYPRRLLGGLVLTQAALTTLLVIGAGLFVRSVERLQSLDMGFVPAEILRVRASLSRTGASQAEVFAFYREAAERIRAIPGVRGIGMAQGAPFMGNYAAELRVPGLDSIPQEAGGGPYYFRFSAGTMEALQMRLLRGRFFTEADDRENAEPVIIVTDRMARRLFADRDPLSQCMFFDDMPCARIVGVVADMHRQGIQERPFMAYFMPLGRIPNSAPEAMMVRVAGDPERMVEPVRRAVHAIREGLPYVDVQPYEELIAPQARSWRLGATMFTAFGALSLLIAAVGIYGVLSFSVAQRMPELGIRAALGAQPGSVLRSVVLGGGIVALAGVAIGAVAAWLLAPRLEPLLFETGAREPAAYAVAAVVIVASALIASVLPGVRASRADPMSVLRVQ